MEYNLLCTYFLFGLIILLATNDFTTIFLTLELQSLSFYVLSRFKKDTIFSINNGLKYFILGSLSSSYFLLGWNLLYGFSCLSLISNYFVIFILYEISQNNCIPINNKNTHVLENIRITLKISDKPESILYKAGIDEELLTKALIGLKKELLLVSASAEKKPINNYYNKAGVSALEHLYWWDGVKVKNPDHLPPSFLLPFPSLVDQYDLNNRGVTRKGRVIKNAIDSYVVWHNFYWSLTFRENKHKLAEVYKKCMVIMIVMLESYTHKGFENQQQQWKIQYLLKLSFVTPEIALTVVKELASKSEN
jgi:hypothetical protein